MTTAITATMAIATTPDTTTLSDVVSCIAGYDPNAVPVAQAQQIIQLFVTPIHAVEKLALRSALGRVLAEDIVSTINVPAHDNSAMDGYAVRGSDLGAEAIPLATVGTAFAAAGDSRAGGGR